MIPTYDADIYADEGILHPYEHYRTIRDLGPVVELTATGALAVGRYEDVQAILLDHKRFQSAKGIALTQATIDGAAGTTLFSDPPVHQILRGVIGAPLTPTALQELREQIELAADELIARLVSQRSFDGMQDLAQFLPVSIVSTLVGLPEEGREEMLSWAAAGFDAGGPQNARTESALPAFGRMIEYLLTKAGPSAVKPGSWAAQVYKAADKGVIPQEAVFKMLIDYVVPSLDTTIFATGHMLDLFGSNPEQWRILRDKPELIPNAVNEVVRIRSPIRGFARYVAEPVNVSGTEIPMGRSVVVLYASANRDERKWEDPDLFNIERKNVQQQVGFGVGRHVCAGQHLARLEISALLKAMVKRVASFSVAPATHHINNILYGFSRLPVTIQ